MTEIRYFPGAVPTTEMPRCCKIRITTYGTKSPSTCTVCGATLYVKDRQWWRELGDPYLELDGFSVSLYRSDTGQVSIQIDTSDACDNDPASHTEAGEPFLQVHLNDATLYDLETDEQKQARA